MRALLTFAVSIIIDLDFGSSEAGISMQLTVVEVGLAIAATHRSLVRFALLKQTMEDAGIVKAEFVCAPHRHTHTHTHTHTHSHLVKSPPQQRWLLPCQGTGSLSSGISNYTLLSVGGITSPCSPSWCSVLILALGHLFFSVKRNTHSLTPILSNQQEGHFIRSQESGLSITLSLCRKSFNVCIENPLKFQNFMTQNSQSWEFGNIERNVSTAPDPHHPNSSIISGSSYKNLCSVALFSILFFS